MDGSRENHLAWIALGSNIAPEIHLPLAVAALSENHELVNVSSIWQSAPVGDTNQSDFCNAAVRLRTSLSPRELKSVLREIEARLGRVRDPSNKNAARTIDLDIAFYDDLLIDEPDLKIPDPDIPQRNFLAVPLAELDPDYKHPATGQTLRSVAQLTGSTTNLLRRDDVSLFH